VLAKTYLFSAPQKDVAAETTAPRSPAPTSPQRQLIQVGKKIALPGIDWSKSARTVVLALSTGCHFCSESAPFYQKLQQQNPSNVRLVAVLPQSVEEGRNYLTKLGVSLNEVVQAPLASVSVSGTPTLLLINHDGVVTDSWVGKLSDGEAAKVMSRIKENMVQ
jgi:thiol-disulfide isomerase/thioredoxin